MGSIALIWYCRNLSNKYQDSSSWRSILLEHLAINPFFISNLCEIVRGWGQKYIYFSYGRCTKKPHENKSVCSMHFGAVWVFFLSMVLIKFKFTMVKLYSLTNKNNVYNIIPNDWLTKYNGNHLMWLLLVRQ